MLAAGALEGVDDVEHAGSRAGSQVEDAHAAPRSVCGGLALDGGGAGRRAGAHLAAHPVERRHVAARQVDHVDVVAHARAVGRGVVVAEHAHAGKPSHGHLGHVGQQVVGDALGIFANQPACVCADGVKVAQQHHVPLVVSHVQVGQDAFEHALGLAIGIRGLVLGAFLGDGHEVGLAVDGGAGGKDEVLHAMRPRHVAQRQGSGDVVPIVFQRLLHAFADGLECGEVDDGVDVVRGKDPLKRLPVEDVGLVKRQAVALGVCIGAGDGAHAGHGLFAGIAQIVHDDHAIPLVKQLDAGVGSNEPGASRHQDAGFFVGLCKGLVRHGSRVSFSSSFRAVRCAPYDTS